MHAVIVDRFNEAPRLADLQTPRPGANELLLKVAAAGVNPMDIAMTRGAFEETLPATFPLILGADVAAEVADAGPGASRFAPGDRVFGQLLLAPLGSSGTYADYVRVPEDAPLATLPAGLDYVTAAAIPTPGGTARLVADSLGDVAGRTVLVVGAAGGVGSYATQILAGRGAEVIAGARARDAQRVTGYGATATLDRTEAPLDESLAARWPAGIDGLVDVASGPAEFAALAAHVRAGGAAVSTTYAADVPALEQAGVRATNVLLRADGAVFAELGAAVAAGELAVPPVKEVTLDEMPGLLAPDAPPLRGKTVIRHG